MRSRAFQGLQNNLQKAFLWTPRTSTLFCGVGVGWALGGLLGFARFGWEGGLACCQIPATLPNKTGHRPEKRFRREKILFIKKSAGKKEKTTATKKKAFRQEKFVDGKRRPFIKNRYNERERTTRKNRTLDSRKDTFRRK